MLTVKYCDKNINVIINLIKITDYIEWVRYCTKNRDIDIFKRQRVLKRINKKQVTFTLRENQITEKKHYKHCAFSQLEDKKSIMIWKDIR